VSKIPAERLDFYAVVLLVKPLTAQWWWIDRGPVLGAGVPAASSGKRAEQCQEI